MVQKNINANLMPISNLIFLYLYKKVQQVLRLRKLADALNHTNTVGQFSFSPVLIKTTVWTRHSIRGMSSCWCSVGCAWPYSAVPQCSWPGGVCWLLSSCHPWALFSCERLQRVEPAHPQRWWGSDPACWSSAACLRAHPAPGSQRETLGDVCGITEIFYLLLV